MEKFSVSRLIGSPPGYVGYEEGGELTEAVRRNPYSVVLFDEIEKAHPDVLNLLLQVLDDGRLTDSNGRTVDFRNTIIIMTSNLGSSEILNGHSEKVIDLVKHTFRPEFVNRIDEIIIFNKLSFDDTLKILDKIISNIEERLKYSNIKIYLTDNCRKYLAKEGYSEEFGARPLKRFVTETIENILAKKIINGEIHENSIACFDYINNEIILKRE